MTRRETIQPANRNGYLRFTRSLAITAHNLDLVRSDSGLVIQLESDIFDQESPDFIAKSVRVQVTLFESTNTN